MGGAPGRADAPAEVVAPTIVISAVGDCTLGNDYRVTRAPGTFNHEMEAVGNDYRYPFSGVLDVLGRDDLTIANLETTLTTATTAIEARFVFAGKPEYARILKEGSVEAVNVANNHSYDLGVKGFEQTLGALREHGVAFFGNGHIDRRVIKGIEVVNLGYTGGRTLIRPDMVAKVKASKRPENLVIVSFHWGVEGINQPIDEQKHLGRAAIDAGADLVLGHHPHVLQGIEERNGRQIVYSLGNFVFGGHSNPTDKDSMIYQALFTLKEGRVEPAGTRILPVRISSVTDRNDYRPVLLEGAERERVLGRVEQFSAALLPKTARAVAHARE
jgi:poly-gamma-glutamate synthesis protein (capsule biosynthesis protein)